jgi:hypothetical protein
VTSTEPLSDRLGRAQVALDRLRAQPRVRFIDSTPDQRDFAVLDSGGRIRELVHVADGGDLLAGANGFFHVVLAQEAPATVVALSAIAPELREGWSQAGAARQPIGWKLRDLGFSPTDQEKLFERVSLAGGPDGAPDGETLAVLTAWLAGRDGVDRSELEARVVAVKALQQARAAHQLDVGGLLTALPDGVLPIDAPPDRARSLAEAIGEAPLAVVHGDARGAVAGRFFAEQVPARLRFRLNGLPDRRQAAAMRALLEPHAEAIGLPVILWCDLPRAPRGWAEALAQLVSPHVRVVAGVDEPDWRGAVVEGSLTAGEVAVPSTTPPEPPAFASLGEDELEAALEASFARSGERVGEAVALSLRSWTGVAGVARALLYRGLVEHAEAEREVIAETVDRFGAAWPVVLDTDLAKLGDASSWLESGGLTEQSYEYVTGLRARQRPATQVFAHLRAFLSREHAVAPPSSTGDWRGLAEVAFWRRRLELPAPTFDPPQLEAARLPLADLAYVSSSLEVSLPRASLLPRLRDEAEVLEVHEEDGALIAQYLTRGASDEALLDRTLEIIWLLRGLFPGHDGYGARGYGHSPAGEDPARLRVPADRLPAPQLIELNARWLRIAELGLRPDDARAHGDEAIALRKLALQRLTELVKALDAYFRKQKGVALPGTLVDVLKLEETSLRTGRPPLLPRTSVDPWGLASEVDTPTGSEAPPLLRNRRALALEPLNAYLASQRRLFAGLTLFLRQSVPVLAIHSLTKSHSPEAVLKVAEKVGFDAEARETSVRALAEALRSLRPYQRELRAWFGETEEDLALLERRERDTYAAAFVLWEKFAHHPSQTVELGHPEHLLDEARKNAHETLRRHLRKLSKESIGAALLSGELTWEDDPALWIKFDVRSPSQVYSAYLAMHRALQAGLHEVGLSPLLRHALALEAQRVVVVPLVGGKALQRAAWVATPATIAEGDPQLWLKQLNRPARADEWEAAGISTWDDPRLDRAAELQTSVRALHELLTHLADLERAGSLADDPTVQAHVAGRRAELAPLVARVTEEVAEVVEVLHAVPEAERPRRLALLAAVQRLAEFYQGSIASLLPPDGSLPDLAQLAAGARQLEKGLSETEVFRLLWSADVLGIPVGP